MVALTTPPNASTTHGQDDTTPSGASDPLLNDTASTSETLASGQPGRSFQPGSPISTPLRGMEAKRSKPKVKLWYDFPGKTISAYRNSRTWFSQQSWWPLEVGYWLLSLVFIFAIVGVLAVFDGKTIPQWRFGITVNTLVSIFGTINVLLLTIVISAAVGQIKWIWFRRQARPLVDFDIIDEASKGPQGSVTLLLRWRGGSPAIIGACLTILILAIGPFLQQIIAFQNEPIAELTAFIPTAQSYDPTNNNQQTTLNVDMKAAVVGGALTTAVNTYQVSPFCPTGNCTWPAYQSLAMCSACAVTDNSAIAQLLDMTEANITVLNELDSCIVAPFWDPTALNFGNDPGYLTTLTPTLAFHNHGLLLADVFLIGGEKTFECILAFCLQTYTANVSSGVFNETILNTTLQSGPTTILTSYNDAGDGTADDLPVLSFPHSPTKHTVTPDSLYYLSAYLNSTFSGYVESAPDNGENSESSLTITSDAVEAIYTLLNSQDTPDPSLIFANTALSLTRAIRTHAADTEGQVVTRAMGSALHSSTFIRVRWAWIILPGIIQICVLIFLGGVIFMTQRAGLEAYKDGVLPALFLGIDEESRRGMGRLTLLGDMDRVAEETNVMLRDGADVGWELHGVAGKV